MHQQHPGRAAPGRLLELPGPATVLGEVGAAEAARLPGGGRRLVHQHEQQLPPQVGPLVVVPALGGGLDAEAHEDHLGLEPHLAAALPAGRHQVLAERRRQRAAGAVEGERALGGPELHALHLGALQVALAHRRRQPQRPELGLQVADRQRPAALPGAAPLQEVVGQEGQVGAQGGLLDQGAGPGGRGRRGRGEDGGEEGGWQRVHGGGPHGWRRILARALVRGFRPVPLGLGLTARLTSDVRTFTQENVAGVVRGTDPALAREAVLYSAHWDHFGVVDGTIRNGAVDNASGCAAALALAQAAAGSPARRSQVFLFTFGEEQGLLGASAWVQEGPWPVADTVANLNLESLNFVCLLYTSPSPRD